MTTHLLEDILQQSINLYLPSSSAGAVAFLRRGKRGRAPPKFGLATLSIHDLHMMAVNFPAIVARYDRPVCYAAAASVHHSQFKDKLRSMIKTYY